MVSGPYQVDEDTIERHDLDAEDLGRWYVLVNGGLFLYDDEERAKELIRLLNGERLEPVKDAAYYLNLD
jgi:hypothetical protein